MDGTENEIKNAHTIQQTDRKDVACLLLRVRQWVEVRRKSVEIRCYMYYVNCGYYLRSDRRFPHEKYGRERGQRVLEG